MAVNVEQLSDPLENICGPDAQHNTFHAGQEIQTGSIAFVTNLENSNFSRLHFGHFWEVLDAEEFQAVSGSLLETFGSELRSTGMSEYAV